MNRCRWPLFGLLLAAATCQSPGDLPVGPGGEAGAVALQVLAPALATVPATSGVARLTGNGVDETRTLAPGQSSSLSVPPGTYTLVLAGLANGGVVSLGQRGGIVVESGAETRASVQLQSFVPDAPAAPGSALQGQAVTVTWDAVPGASGGYDLEWSTAANFSGEVQRQTTTQRSVSVTPAAGTLYFRVRALTNALTTPGHWSPVSGGTEVGQADPPVITLGSDSLRFTAQEGGPSPALQTVAVTNGGGGTLNGLSAVVTGYGSGQPTGWLTAALDGASAPAGLRLTPDIAGLTPGRFTATVEVRSTVAGVAPASITVILDVASDTDPASIELNVTRRAFVADAGGANPDEQFVQVTNGGGGDLDDLTLTILGSGAPPDGWLTATLDTTSAPATIRLQPNIRGLSPGGYSSTVQVRSPDANNSPQSFVVALSVRQPPVAPSIRLARDSVPFTAIEGQTPGVQTVTVTNGGAGTLGGLTTAVVSSNSGWLTAELNGVTAPASLILRASADTLAAGTYTALVEVRTPQASNNPQTVRVSFTVTQGPTINLAPTTVAFSTAQGSSPAAQTVAITNSGGGAVGGLAVSVATYTGGATGWLTASRNSATAPSTLTLTPSTAALSPGTYTATVQVTSTTARNSPQSLAVTLTVTGGTTAPDTFTVTVTASPAAGGTVSGGGDFVSGDSATVVATPNAGYTFTGWTEGSTQVATSASYTFPVTGDRTLVAVFEAPAAVCTAPSVTEMDAERGLILNVTITATVATGGCATEVWTTLTRTPLFGSPVTTTSPTVTLPATPTPAAIAPVLFTGLNAIASYTARVIARNSAGVDTSAVSFTTGILSDPSGPGGIVGQTTTGGLPVGAGPVALVPVEAHPATRTSSSSDYRPSPRSSGRPLRNGATQDVVARRSLPAFASVASDTDALRHHPAGWGGGIGPPIMVTVSG